MTSAPLGVTASKFQHGYRWLWILYLLLFLTSVAALSLSDGLDVAGIPIVLIAVSCCFALHCLLTCYAYWRWFRNWNVVWQPDEVEAR